MIFDSFLKTFPFQILIHLKNAHFFQIFKLQHNYSQTTYFENIQVSKIHFHYVIVLAKNSYNGSASIFWKIFLFQISIFFKNVHFSQIFKFPHNHSQNYLF